MSTYKIIIKSQKSGPIAPAEKESLEKIIHETLPSLPHAIHLKNISTEDHGECLSLVINFTEFVRHEEQAALAKTLEEKIIAANYTILRDRINAVPTSVTEKIIAALLNPRETENKPLNLSPLWAVESFRPLIGKELALPEEFTKNFHRHSTNFNFNSILYAQTVFKLSGGFLLGGFHPHANCTEITIGFLLAMRDDSKKMEASLNQLLNALEHGNKDLPIPPISSKAIFETTSPKIWDTFIEKLALALTTELAKEEKEQEKIEQKRLKTLVGMLEATLANDKSATENLSPQSLLFQTAQKSTLQQQIERAKALLSPPNNPVQMPENH